MAFFGSDWLEGYDSLYEYETHVGGMATAKEYMEMKYDNPIGAPCSTDDEYYPHDDESGGIKHFGD